MSKLVVFYLDHKTVRIDCLKSINSWKMSGLDSNLEETFGQANNTNPLWIELVQEMQQWRHSNPEAQWLQPQAFAALRHYWTKFKTTEFGYHYSKAKKLIDGKGMQFFI